MSYLQVALLALNNYLQRLTFWDSILIVILASGYARMFAVFSKTRMAGCASTTWLTVTGIVNFNFWQKEF